MTEQEQPEAVEHKGHRFAWIWAVPIAALAIVGYLAFQQLSQGGPSVTVVFPTAGGLKANDTKVKYEGMEVGSVTKVALQSDLHTVKVELSLDPELSGHLGPGTRFWIQGESLSLTNLSSLKSVISGPFIAIEPHPGDAADSYQGLAQRPVNAYDAHVVHFALQTATLGNVGRGSVVYYHGLSVGHVADTTLEPDSGKFRIDVMIDAPHQKLVHPGTRFWNAGPVQVAMGPNGPSLAMQSLPALVEGAIAFETPAAASADQPAKPDTVFPLYASQDAAEHAPGSEAVPYRVVFPAKEAGGLSQGAPVTLAGARVGTVVDSALQWDPSAGKLAVTAAIALDPHTIALADGDHWAAKPRPQMDALLRTLIGQGLRARLAASIPLVGGKTIALGFVPNPTPATLGAGDPPEIPTASGADIDSLLASVGGVVGKIDAMPLDQIAAEIHDATRHIASLTADPALSQSLDHLEKAMANAETITREARTQVGPALEAVRRTAREAESTVAAARRLVSTSTLAGTGPTTGSVGDTLYELSRAARSLRELADYLDRHPEALLRGKGGPG